MSPRSRHSIAGCGALPAFVEELGTGAHSVVYRATFDGVDYAVKIQRDDSGGEAGRLAFRREAAILACVRHPALAQIEEVGEHEGRSFLVMELLHGTTVRAAQAAAGRPMTEAEAVAMARDAAGGLAAAHRAGLVHRDVKPENLFLTRDGTTKVIDFGLATQAGTAQDAGATVGTALYSPPEQTGMLKRPVDGRSDLYSLGVVLFECVAGHRPFDAADVGELVRRHAVEAPPDLRQLRPDLSPAFVAMVERLLAKDPDDRYQTGQGLLADLDQLARPAGPSPADFPVGRYDDPATVVYDLPLAGRADELAQLLGQWHEASAGRGSVALLTGLPGGGKSRLARELARRAGDDGALVLAGKASFDNPIPLLALREAIEEHLRAVDRLAEPARAEARARVTGAAGASGPLLAALSPELAALLGQAPAPVALAATHDRQEQFLAAVGQFLVDLAAAHGCAVLALDDLQWLDDASRRVLTGLVPHLANAPLLVLATARDGSDSASVGLDPVAELTAELGDAVRIQHLGPLDLDAVGALARQWLGRQPADPAFLQRLHDRAHGNPLATLVYLRAVVDSGLLRPSWGTCAVDLEALDQLDLPDDVMELLVRRADDLGPDARALLVAGATMGSRFRPATLAPVLEIDDQHVALALGNALQAGLVEHRDGGDYGFVHDRVREAMLAPLDPPERRRLHQRIAEAVEAGEAPSAGRTFALARHYALGEAERTPRKVFVWNRDAGRAALANHAAADAAEFLLVAEQAATTAGIDLDADFGETLGVALLRVDDVEGAEARLRAALELATDGQSRARIHTALARVENAHYRMDELWTEAAAGLAALGHPLPSGRLRFWVGSLWRGLVGIVLTLRGRGFGAADPTEQTELRLRLALHHLGAVACYGRLQPFRMAALTLRSLPLVHRLGNSAELVSVDHELSMLAASVKLAKLQARIEARAIRVAEQLGDPAVFADAAMTQALLQDVIGHNVEAGDQGQRLLRRQAQWLPTELLTSAAAAIPLNFDLRGYSREANALWLIAHQRLKRSKAPGAACNIYIFEGLAVYAALGQTAEANRLLAEADVALDAIEAGRFVRICHVQARLRCMIEEDQLDRYDELVAEQDAFALSPLTTPVWLKTGWATPAQAALERLRRSTDAAARPGLVAEARKRVKGLGRVAREPIYQAHHRATQAALASLTGKARSAQRHCREAERLAILADAPKIHFEVARVRARLAAAAGDDRECRRQVEIAAGLAAREGWVEHGRLLRSEFAQARTASSSLPRSDRSPAGAEVPTTHAVTTGGSALQSRRSLDALMTLSVATSRLRDPDEFARGALDQLVALLGAERAFLFLHGEGGRLTVSAARNAAGADLVGVTDYASTIVDEVGDEQRALVVTGTAEGAALGSESAVRHDLRSILAAPLVLEGRCVGVVYLDSRLAKGIFDDDDLEILSAISAHIAVSLVTARAAQLELAVAAERDQRRFAESLRDFMTAVSAVRDPDKVLDEAVLMARRTIAYDRAVLLDRHGRDWIVRRADGDFGDRVFGPGAVRLGAEPHLLSLSAASVPIVGGDATHPAPTVLGPAGSWLSVPVVRGGRLIGAALYSTDAPGRLGEVQLGLVASLSVQVLAAYLNAELYQEIERLATTDELTGVSNRRQVIELGERAFAQARRHQHSVSVVMLDIDHFKRVNDTYGHTAGDDVLRAVAARLRAAIRDVDLIGRYGGEEFALVLAHTDEREAAALAERLRAAVGGEPMVVGSRRLTITASVGVAVASNGSTDLAGALARADAALYEAKAQGRDRVIMAANGG